MTLSNSVPFDICRAAAMLEITCHGTPAEIGFQHGRAAASQIASGIGFYKNLFTQYSGKEWAEIHAIGRRFAQTISQNWPRYYDEMQGITKRSQRNIIEIIALNVRTQIAFVLMRDDLPSDGCTTLSFSSGSHAYLGQNWDWMEGQKYNLILLTIVTPGLPHIKMVTEAGIVGKIGINERVVGVYFNAIRVRGLDETRVAVHLALRIALESSSASQAAGKLETQGVAGSAHILVADSRESISLEVTPTAFVRIPQDEYGRIMHTNHVLQQRDGIDELPELDSICRMDRIPLFDYRLECN